MVVFTLGGEVIDWVKTTYEKINIDDLAYVTYTQRGKGGGRQFDCSGRIEIKTKKIIGIQGHTPIRRKWINRIYKGIVNDGHGK